MMEAFLFIDFGSTYTKLTAVSAKEDLILATAKSYTTVETDVMDGYEEAYKDLMTRLDNRIKFIKKLACSSAAGGLKIVAIGLVPELTMEAAKRAALGAGARVTDVFSFKMNKSEIRQIQESKADMILLAGGTNGGNTDVILHNAKMLRDAEIKVPIVVAGNKSCNDEITDIFEGYVNYHITENVMPSLNSINVEPAREAIRKIFMKNIVKAKGMVHVKEFISGILMPTPAAVLKAAEILSEGTKDEDGIGDLAVIDIGGATTDVHTICEGAPSKPSVILRGLEEPVAKRTVEGDLGMRYSALSLYEAAGKRYLRRHHLENISEIDVGKEFSYRNQHTDFIPVKEEDIAFDEVMAKICVDISMKRHAGTVTQVYSPLGMMYSQEGKDLMELPYLLGTGGVIVNSKNPKEILKAGLFHEEDMESLKPRHPKYLLDEMYVLSALGLLAMVDEDKALRMLKKYIVKC
ncbi:MAG TPA: methylaspartate mutase accessory protein GlmL [Proteiniclasticum sp.]|nr:methylaspartate mutase accessory protein GlmL [Proteiniclasticum sp.]